MFSGYIVEMVVQLGEQTKRHWIMYFKKMNFMVRELYQEEKVGGKA